MVILIKIIHFKKLRFIKNNVYVYITTLILGYLVDMM